MGKLPLVFAATVAVLGIGSSAKSQSLDVGTFEFKWACSTCHGIDAKGKGPLSTELKTPPPDLTVLAKKRTAGYFL
jgi:hypothetical protein